MALRSFHFDARRLIIVTLPTSSAPLTITTTSLNTFAFNAFFFTLIHLFSPLAGGWEQPQLHVLIVVGEFDAWRVVLALGSPLYPTTLPGGVLNGNALL